jgi:hypothetical protein
MITYKPYHYHLIFTIGYAVAYLGSLYLILAIERPHSIVYLTAGFTLAMFWHCYRKFLHERRSWRSVERIMEYAKGGESHG